MTMKAPEYILSRPWAMLPDRVESMLAVAERTIDVEAVMAKLGKPLENTQDVQIRGNVAVIPVNGIISRYADMFTMICGGTTVEHLSRDIRTALDNEDIHAIILEIDSPGGQAAGIGELAAQIREGTKTKPIVSYVSNLGASAGYWIASAGSEIVASPSAILGSVGVVWPMSRTTSDGRTIEFVSSQSPNKRLSTETPEGRAKYQELVDAMADVFVSAVAENREITPEKVISDFGAGGLKVGQAAVDAGMADRLGSLEQLISELSNGGPAGSSLPIKHGGAADAGSKDQKMKVPFASFFASWAKGGFGETVDLDEAASSPEVIKNNEVLVARALGGDPEVTTLKAKIAELEAAQSKGQEAEAVAWFQAHVKEGKAIPAEQEAYVFMYTESARLDASNPQPKLSRLGTLKASFEGRKPSGVTTESIPTDAASVAGQLAKGGFKILPSAATTPSEAEAKADAETVAAMLAAALDD